MSDAAFKTAKYPSYTAAQLAGFVASGAGNDAMVSEISRRAKADAGDFSVMTSAERLRFLKGQ